MNMSANNTSNLQTTLAFGNQSSPVSANPFLDDQAQDQNLIFSDDKIINILYIAIGSLGTIANGFVIFVFIASKKLRKFRQLTNIYILNQSLLDFLGAVFLVFLTTFENKEGEKLSGIGGELYCRLWLSKLPLWSIFVSSTFNLVVINVERYFGIIHPLWHKVNFSGTTIKVTLVFIWSIGPIYNAGYMISTSFVENGECFFLVAWHPISQRFVGILTVVIQFFFPIIIHGFCLFRIVHCLHRRANVIEDISQNAQFNKNRQAFKQAKVSFVEGSVTRGEPVGGSNVLQTHVDHHNKKRGEAIKIRNQVLKTLALMTLCFILCWVWNQVFFLLFNLGIAVSFQGVFYHFTVVAVYINCFTNPFIYMLKYKNFRDAAKGIFLKGQTIGQTSQIDSGATN